MQFKTVIFKHISLHKSYRKDSLIWKKNIFLFRFYFLFHFFFLCRFHQRADTLSGNLCLMHRIKQFCSARGLYRQLYKTCQKCCKRCNIPGSATPVSKTSVVNFRIPSTQSSTSRIALVMISPSPSSTPAFSHEFSGSHLFTNYIY